MEGHSAETDTIMFSRRVYKLHSLLYLLLQVSIKGGKVFLYLRKSFLVIFRGEREGRGGFGLQKLDTRWFARPSQDFISDKRRAVLFYVVVLFCSLATVLKIIYGTKIQALSFVRLVEHCICVSVLVGVLVGECACLI